MIPAASTDTEAAVLRDFSTALAEGQISNALAVIRTMPAHIRESFDIAAHEADLSGKLGRHEEEVRLLRQLIAREPKMASLQVGLANALKTLGRRDQAIAAARAALSLQPDYGKAWWMLADLKNYNFTDEEVAAMEIAVANELSPTDLLHLHFALGRAFEQRGKTEQAFASYAAANRVAATMARPESPPVEKRVDRAIAQFTHEFFAERAGFGANSDAPIFIVGLHRSGSTVLEQILASHPAIEATAELPVVAQLLRDVGRANDLDGATPVAKLASLDENRARDLGDRYLDRARHYRTTKRPHFIDKMPANWLYIGFIHLILPKARIIDARRHPMAAGFSNFRQNYGSGVPWAYSLETIGRYYQDYLRLMRHFDGVLPGRVHRVINEQLIADFEPEVRRLLDHVGVDFDPACLEFHRSDRPVRSASAEQVRRPINSDGVDQWRAFEPWLDPLKQALGPALEDWRE